MQNSWPIINLNEVDSTNNYATSLLSDNKIVTESVITAYSQTQGRGQTGNYWLSQPGLNLTFSLVLFTNYLYVQNQFALSQAISLGLTDYFFKQKADAKVKWPNDIFVNNKKIAGILIENAIMGSNLMHSVIGIGINMNQSQFETGLQMATSLCIETGKNYDLANELNQILVCLKKRVEILKTGNLAALKTEYLSKLLAYNKLSQFKAKGGLFRGLITDIKPFGELVILADDGTLREFMFKEVEFMFSEQ